MANETLSIKLHELDEKVSRVYSRILMTESADHASIHREKALLRQECTEMEQSIRENMHKSKAQIVGTFSDAYDELEKVIDDTKNRLNLVLGQTDVCGSETPILTSLIPDDLSGLSREELIELTERKILLAEYALDFAMLAADHALLFSLDAMDAQMTAEEAES